MTAAAFDLTDPRTLLLAHEQGRVRDLYAQLAAQAPVWELPGGLGFHLVSTPDLVEEAVARPEDFSSKMTRFLYVGDDGRPAAYSMMGMGDDTDALATADPPAHDDQRRLINGAFSKRSVAALTQEVTDIAQELVGRFAQGQVDATRELADPLTMRVLCRVVGLPEEDAPDLVTSVIAMDRMICGLADREAMDAGATAALMLGIKLSEHLAQPAVPGSVLARLQELIADGALLEGQVIAILMQLVTAGTETTATLIGRAVRHLAEDPRRQDELRRHPDEIAAFLDNLLREDGPFQYHYRTVVRDTILGGVALPAGATVLLMWAAADQNRSSQADPSAPHLAFGRGNHFCLGAHLARLEAAVSLRVLLAESERFSPVVDAPASSRPSLMMSRPDRTPIQWVPAGATG